MVYFRAWLNFNFFLNQFYCLSQEHEVCPDKNEYYDNCKQHNSAFFPSNTFSQSDEHTLSFIGIGVPHTGQCLCGSTAILSP